MNASMQDNVIDEGDRERLIEAAFAGMFLNVFSVLTNLAHARERSPPL